MIISYWGMAYEIGELSEVLLRAVARNLFAGEVGQQYWRDARERRLSTSADKRTRRFHEILDEEYREVTQPPPAPPPSAPEPDGPEPRGGEPPSQAPPDPPSPPREDPPAAHVAED